MQYIYQLTDWPKFHWDERAIAGLVGEVRHAKGKLAGKMQMLGFPLEQEDVLATITEDVLKSSEIEGEILNKDPLRSSVARRLGMDIGALAEPDRDVEGVVAMMLDATQRFASPLSDDRLFIYMKLNGDETHDKLVSQLKRAGRPVLTLKLNDLHDLGAEFFRWEFATAVAG